MPAIARRASGPLIDQEYLEDVSGEHRMHRNAARKAATRAEHRLEKLPSCRYPLY